MRRGRGMLRGGGLEDKEGGLRMRRGGELEDDRYE